jgi:hypothetical protein
MNKPVYERKRIKPISESRAVQLRLYAKLKRAWWQEPENQFCCVEGCHRHAADVHHTFGRAGELLCLSKHWAPVCRPHHTRVRDDIGWARQQKLLPAFGFNRIEVAQRSEPIFTKRAPARAGAF